MQSELNVEEVVNDRSLKVCSFAHHVLQSHIHDPLLSDMNGVCPFFSSDLQWKVQNTLLASKGEVKLRLWRGAASLEVWIQAGAEAVTCCWVLTAGGSPSGPLWPHVQHTCIPLWSLYCVTPAVKQSSLCYFHGQHCTKRFFKKTMKCFHSGLCSHCRLWFKSCVSFLGSQFFLHEGGFAV